MRTSDGFGHEMGTGRPVVIVASEKGIATSPLLQVAFLTCTPKDLSCCVELSTQRRKSWVICNQINSVDVRRLDEPNSCVTSEELQKIDDAIKIVFGFDGKSENMVAVDKTDEIKERMGSELYQKLYTKAMADLVETRYKFDELQLKYGRLEKTKPLEEFCFGGAHLVSPPPVVDVDALKEQMSTPSWDVELVEPVDRDEDIPGHLGKCSGGNKKRFTVTEIENILRVNGYSLSAAGSGRMKLAKDAKPVNVNTATPSELCALGMGKNVAYAITKHRAENGDFTCFEDLLLVDKFGSNVARMFGPYLEV